MYIIFTNHYFGPFGSQADKVTLVSGDGEIIATAIRYEGTTRYTVDIPEGRDILLYRTWQDALSSASGISPDEILDLPQQEDWE